MFGVGSNPVVNTDIGNGDVELILGPADSITVTAELRKPESIEYSATRDGNTITVIAKTKNNSRADETITVPADTTFSLSTGSGDVDVPAVNASGSVNSGSGSLTLVNTGGDVTGSTGSGDVDARDLEGSFGLSSGSGDVDFKGELAQGSENKFSSGSGSVTAQLTGTPSVDLDLKIEQEGKIRVELSETVVENTEHRFAGTVGAGDAALTVRAGDGDIVVE